MELIDRIKERTSLVQKIGDVDLYRKIVELQAEIVKLSTKNFELEKTCFDFREKFAQKSNLRHARQLYYLESDPIPFCPRCWETTEKMIHLFSTEMLSPDVERWGCHVCQYDFTAKPGEAFSATKSRHR